MTLDESGQLSLDFLIGFTIFLIGFIFAITMASGLLVSLMSKTVDYDAVAYRTSIILVEDPGWALDAVSNESIPNWELINPVNREEDLLRAGLALTKSSPGILTMEKINEFFALDDDEIHKKVLFDTPVSQGGISQYSYRYNITLRSIDGTIQKQIGDAVPENKDTGYMKRVVKIKQPSSAVINVEDHFPDPIEDATGEFIVNLNIDGLYTERTDPLYRIDPLTENITVVLTNVNGLPSSLYGVSLYNDFDPPLPDTSTDTRLETLIENVHYFVNATAGTITLNLEPQFFFERDIKPRLDPRVFHGRYYFKFSFDTDYVPIGGLLPDYNYDYTGASQPDLLPAVLEVRIW